jgi:hypothetical protein
MYNNATSRVSICDGCNSIYINIENSGEVYIFLIEKNIKSFNNMISCIKHKKINIDEELFVMQMLEMLGI